MTFEDFIMQAREMNASDIHLTVGSPTVVRVNGVLQKYTELSDQVVNRTILSINCEAFRFPRRSGRGGRTLKCRAEIEVRIKSVGDGRVPVSVLGAAEDELRLRDAPRAHQRSVRAVSRVPDTDTLPA